MRRDELNLDLDRRRQILELIQAYPGLHLSDLARRLDWTPMLAEYHVRILEQHGLISSLQEAHYHRYYARVQREGFQVDALGAQDKRILGLLRHPVRLHIAAYLAANIAARNKELANAIGMSRPAVTYQLGKLVKAGIVLKDGSDLYRLVDPTTVTRLLISYRPPEDVLSSFKDLWDRLGSAQ